MTDLTAEACRRLWASVILTALADLNAAHVRARREKNPRPTTEQVETAARLWIRSAWGRQVAAMAGIELDPGRAVELIRLPRVEFKARMVVVSTVTEEAP